MSVSIKSLSWIDLSVWVRESRDSIRNAIIDNISSLSGSLVLRLRLVSGERAYLVILPNISIYMSRREIYERRDSSLKTSFIVSLKRFIKDCRIVEISQIPCERILEMSISCGRESYILTVELIPRGVITLRDSENIIRVINSPLRAKDRVLRVRTKYIAPPHRSVISCEKDLDKLINNLLRGYDLVRGLVVGLGVPSDVSEEFLYREKLDKKTDPRSLELEKLKSIVLNLENFISSIIERPQPCVMFDESNNPTEFHVIVPSGKSDKCLIVGGLNEALDEYYTSMILSRTQDMREVEELDNLLNKLASDREMLEKTLFEYREQLRFFEENYVELEEIYECYKNNIHTPERCPKTTSSNAIIELDREKQEIVFRFSSGVLRISLRTDFNENYFKLKRNLSHIEKSIKRIDEEIASVRERVTEKRREIEMMREIMRIKSMRKRYWFERYHWYITSEGLIAIGGRDADQNESIVKRYLEDNDLFFHADIQGGSVFILKNSGKAGEESIYEVAYLAGCYSRAWSMGFGSIDVFYVKGAQVSKSPPPGEYLAKGSFMIYGERNWVKNIQLRLGIGIEISKDNVPRVVIAPPHVISKKTDIYAIIAPGDLAPEEVARKLQSKWLELHRDLEIMIKAVDIDEIIKRVPGRSVILEIR